jgi:hypothetical protein
MDMTIEMNVFLLRIKSCVKTDFRHLFEKKNMSLKNEM